MNLLEMASQIFVRRAANQMTSFGPYPLIDPEREKENRELERAEDVHIAKRSIQLAEAFRDAWTERIEGRTLLPDPDQEPITVELMTGQRIDLP